jgi:hypothetical protein
MVAVSMFVFGVISIEVWKTQMPVWAFVLALVIGTSVRDSLSGFPMNPLLSLCIYHSHRHDSSYHQSASRLKVSAPACL